MYQDIQDISATQRYIIGQKYDLDNRRFRYSQAAVALAGLARLVINKNICPGATGYENDFGFEGAIGYAASIGDEYVDIADTASRAKNYYQGGMLIIYGTTIFHQHYIVKSDAGNGSYVRCYLDKPLAVEDVTVAMGCTAYRNEYSALSPVAGSGVAAGFAKFVGVNLVPVTINYFCWLQTKGPCIVTPTGGTWPGSTVNLRDVYVNNADGTIQPATLSDPSAGYQRVGTLISATINTYGDLLIDLDVDPE